MKRKLQPLISCPELLIVNKTMIIEVPEELRKPGEPIFRIVSKFDDLENPKIKYKANSILKTIIEKGFNGRKLDSIATETKDVIPQSSQHEKHKPHEDLLDYKILDDQQCFKVNAPKLPEKDISANYTICPSTANSSPNQNESQFDCISKNYITESDYLSRSAGIMYKGNQKAAPTSPSSPSRRVDFHLSEGHNYRSQGFVAQDANMFSPKNDFDSKATEQMSYCDYSEAGPSNKLSSNNYSWSNQRDKNRLGTSFYSRQTPQETDYDTKHSYNRFSHQECKKPGQAIWASDTSHNFSQSKTSSGSISYYSHELPKRVLQSNPDLSGTNHIIFLDIASYFSFFLDFARIPPAGTHVWIFMHKRFKVKFPKTDVRTRLLNMNILHVVCGDDIHHNLTNVLNDLHQRIPLNILFTVVSKSSFGIVESIIKQKRRPVHIVSSRFNEKMSEVFQRAS